MKLKPKDIPDIRKRLYLNKESKLAVAKAYGYSDTSSFNRGLASIGFCVANTVRPLEDKKALEENLF